MVSVPEEREMSDKDGKILADCLARLKKVVSAMRDRAPTQWWQKELTVWADEAHAVVAEIECLRAENANLKRLLDDANERAAQIEDWQIKCALLQVDRDKARDALTAIPYHVYRDTLKSEPGDHECAWHWFTVAAHEHVSAALGEPFRHEDGGVKE